MATRLPIVATRVGGTSWVIEDEVSGLLVPPGDPAALAKAVMRLLENPAFADDLAARAIQVAQGRYGIDAMVASIGNCYRRLLGEAGR
jgi:glycosyltransferase involved in cell wall biosynthesis